MFIKIDILFFFLFITTYYIISLRSVKTVTSCFLSTPFLTRQNTKFTKKCSLSFGSSIKSLITFRILIFLTHSGLFIYAIHFLLRNNVYIITTSLRSSTTPLTETRHHFTITLLKLFTNRCFSNTGLFKSSFLYTPLL